MRKLVVDTPSTELVDGYLREIARGYGLPWGSDPSEAVEPDKVFNFPSGVFISINPPPGFRGEPQGGKVIG